MHHRRTYKIITLIGFLSLTVHLYSQDIDAIDRSTYDHYMKGEWKPLIREGEDAINSGIDNYFIRMRVAIAYYSLNNFRGSLSHFEAAKELNPADTVANEFLYHAYMWSGRKTDVYRTKSELTQAQLQRLSLKRTQINSIFTDLSSSHNFSPDLLHTEAGDNPSQTMAKSFNMAFVGTSVSLSKKLSAVIAAGYLTKLNSKMIQSNNKQYFEDNEKVSQEQLYLNLLYNIGNGFVINAAGHGLFVSYPIYSVSNKGLSSFPKSIFNYSCNLGISKDFKYWSARISGNYSNLNFSRQIQGTGEIGIYPFGNLNLYGITKLTYQYQSAEDMYVLNQKIGFKAMKMLWVELTASLIPGEVKNFSDDQAFSVYNDVNPITRILGFQLFVPLHNFNVHMGYNYVTSLSGSTLKTSNANYFLYNNHLFSGGILWNF